MIIKYDNNNNVEAIEPASANTSLIFGKTIYDNN